MPVIHIFHHSSPTDLSLSLHRICINAADAIGVPIERCWAIWHEIRREAIFRPDWNEDPTAGPIVRIFCRRSHSRAHVRELMDSLRKSLSCELACRETGVFIQVIRVEDEDVINIGP